jgi:hypothetical protein
MKNFFKNVKLYIKKIFFKNKSLINIITNYYFFNKNYINIFIIFILLEVITMCFIDITSFKEIIDYIYWFDPIFWTWFYKDEIEQGFLYYFFYGIVAGLSYELLIFYYLLVLDFIFFYKKKKISFFFFTYIYIYKYFFF